MTWTAYRVVFRLKSPMHIGCGKVGNVQRTRPYVTGRMFWGALTMRLTRDQHQPATRSELYQKIGGEVHQYLKFTYFYPAIKKQRAINRKRIKTINRIMKSSFLGETKVCFAVGFSAAMLALH